MDDIFSRAISDYENRLQSKPNKQQNKNERTMKILSSLYSVKNILVHHKCSKSFCQPKNAKALGYSKNDLNFYMFMCKYGQYHDCSPGICPGDMDFSCSISGIGKDHGYSGFETEKKSYKNENTRLIHRDNNSYLHDENRELSEMRDKGLNMDLFNYIEYCSSIDKIREGEIKSDYFEEIFKKNRLKKTTKNLIKETIKMKQKTAILKVFTCSVPLYCNNREGTNLFKYGVYLTFDEVFIHLKRFLTAEQYGIQFGYISYRSMLKRSINCSNNPDEMRIIEIIEAVLLKTLPGLYRLENCLVYYRHLHAKCKQYVHYCSINDILPNYHKLYDTLNLGKQRNNERLIHELVNQPQEDYFKDRFFFERYDYTKWPTWENWKNIIHHILRIWILVSKTGANKNTSRKTKDPSEVILGAIYLLKSGDCCKYMPLNSYDIYIPKISYLNDGCVLMFMNELSKITEDALKSHNQGNKIIIEAIQYLSKYYSPKEIYDYIKSGKPLKEQTPK